MPKKKELPEWVITKGQRSRWEREQRNKRIALIAGAIIVGIVLIFGGLAIWDAAKPEPPVFVGIVIDPAVPSMKAGEQLDLKVLKKYDNGKTKSLNSDFVWASSSTPTATIDDTGRVTAHREGAATITVNTSIDKQVYSATATVGVIPPTVLEVGSAAFDMDYCVQTLRVNALLQGSGPDPVSDEPINTLIADEIRRQQAPAFGLTVSEEEIDKEIIAQWVSATAQSATPSYTEIRDNLLPQFEEYEASFDRYRELVRADLLQQKLQKTIGEQEVPKAAPQVHIYGIAFDAAAPASGTPAPTESGSPAAAPTVAENAEKIRQEILERLAEGGDFAALAKEYSKHPTSEKGGDLGWMPREIADLYGAQFGEIAFSLEPDQLSPAFPAGESAENTYYWVIKITEKEEARPLTDEHWNTLSALAESRWLDEQKARITIVHHLDAGLKNWAVQKALETLTGKGTANG